MVQFDHIFRNALRALQPDSLLMFVFLSIQRRQLSRVGRNHYIDISILWGWIHCWEIFGALKWGSITDPVRVGTVTTGAGLAVLAMRWSPTNPANGGGNWSTLASDAMKPTTDVQHRNYNGGDDFDTSIRLSKPLLFKDGFLWLFGNSYITSFTSYVRGWYFILDYLLSSKCSTGWTQYWIWTIAP